MNVRELRIILEQLEYRGHGDDSVLLVCEKHDEKKELESNDIYANGIWEGKSVVSIFVSKEDL